MRANQQLRLSDSFFVSLELLLIVLSYVDFVH